MDFQPSTKLYTCEDLDWALVKWQNMAIHKIKHRNACKVCEKPRSTRVSPCYMSVYDIIIKCLLCFTISEALP
jgi:hypothetical protein